MDKKQKVLFALAVVLVIVAIVVAVKNRPKPEWTSSDKVWTSGPVPPGLAGETRMAMSDAKQKCLAEPSCAGFRRKYMTAAQDADGTQGNTQFFGKPPGKEGPYDAAATDFWTSWYRPGVKKVTA